MGLLARYIIRKRALGDVLWIEPVIAELAKRPGKLIVHTRFNGLFENYPFLNVVFKDRLSFFEKVYVKIMAFFKVRRLVVNLDNSYEKSPRRHFLHSYLIEAGLPLKNVYPKLYLSEKEKKENELGLKGRYVVIHRDNPALKDFRKVFGVDWNILVERLNESGFQVFMLGEPGISIPGAVSGHTTLREMICLINKSSLFIGIDSGPSHIAASLNVPSLLFFGAINPEYRHFTSLFAGKILKQACCFDNDPRHFATSAKAECKIPNEKGLPPCSVYPTEMVIKEINVLLNLKIENDIEKLA